MRIINFVTYFVLVLFASSGIAGAKDPAAPADAFDFSGTEIGQSYPFARVRAHVVGSNVAGRTLEIDRVLPSNTENASVEFEPTRVEAGGTFSMDLEVELGPEVGRVSHHFAVYAKGQSEPIDGFSIHAFADWIVSPVETNINFGVFELVNPVHRTVPLETRPGAKVKLVGIEKPSQFFEATVSKDGMALELKSKEDAPWSSFDERLLVKTDSELQPLVAFRLRGQARGSVVPSSDPLDFGVLREGQGAELILGLNDVTGKPLKIGTVVSNARAEVETRLTDCIPSNPSCKILKVTYPPMSLRGITGGMLDIELPDYQRKLSVRIGALGIGKDTQIRSLEDDLKAAAEAEPSISNSLRQAIRQPELARELPRPSGSGPLLTWQVANENGVYGYEIYRSDAEDGPFHRVTEKIIPRLDESGKVGSIYRWRDQDYKPGATYWYYVNLVYESGRKDKFTSPQKVLAK